MKQSWERAETSIMVFKQELEELYELLPKSVKIHQKTATLNKAWKKVQISLNEMDKFISHFSLNGMKPFTLCKQ